MKSALFATFAISLLFSAFATAADHHGLADKTRRQMQALMDDKAHWSAAQQKLDSRLIYGAREKLTGKAHPAVPRLHSGLTAEADGRIKVKIRGTVTTSLLTAIKAAGGDVLASFPNYRAVYALLPVENIESLAARQDIVFVAPALKPQLGTGSVDTQGDATHLAISARAATGVTGAGITVGVMSDSINNTNNSYPAAVSSGDIIASQFSIPSGQAGSTNYGLAAYTAEGLAMCEIVFDLAPGANVMFATGLPFEETMASNILTLASNGCKIICDDITYPDESPFQDGPIAQAVGTVTSNGVLYFSDARNSGNLLYETSCTWEGDFTNGGAVYTNGDFLNTLSGTYVGQYHLFAPDVATDDILDAGYAYAAALFWTDPLGASTNDYDLYMIDTETSDIVLSSTTVQNGTQDPFEYIDDPNDEYGAGYGLVIVRYSGTNRFLHLDFGRGGLKYATAGCIRGHNGCDAANSFAVGATPAATADDSDGVTYPNGPYPNRFLRSDGIEYFSSDGPRRMFYYADGTPITPGNFSSTGGVVYLKPDVTAADGVATTVPGGLGAGSGGPFYGSSAATPHAAAIAALVWSYNPSLTPSQVRTVLMGSCINNISVNGGWNEDSGNGILMAWAALQYALTPVNLIQNGGFETGDVSYWTNSTTFTNSAITTNAPYVHSGMYGAQLENVGALGYIGQTVPTVPGEKYLVSAWVYCAGVTPNEVQLSWNGSVLFDKTNLGNVGWTNLLFIANATGTNTLYKIGIRDDTGYIGLDDLSVAPGPALTMNYNPGNVNLSWSTMAGQSYQLQYITNLVQTNWVNLGAPMTATNQLLSATDSAATTHQRYYRVVLSP